MYAAGGRAGVCGQSGGGLAGQPSGRRSADRGEEKAAPADPGQASAGASTTARYANVSAAKLLLLLFHDEYWFLSSITQSTHKRQESALHTPHHEFATLKINAITVHLYGSLPGCICTGNYCCMYACTCVCVVS